MKKPAKRIPICAAKDIGNAYGYDQVRVEQEDGDAARHHLGAVGRGLRPDCPRRQPRQARAARLAAKQGVRRAEPGEDAQGANQRA